MPRTKWLWLIPSLRKPVPGRGKAYDDVRNLNDIRLPDTIPPAQAVQCAKFLLEHLDGTPGYREQMNSIARSARACSPRVSFRSRVQLLQGTWMIASDGRRAI